MSKKDPRGHYPKESWPEVVGWPATQAVTKIANERPDVAVLVLGPGSPDILGYNPRRVCVYIDNNGRVIGVPYVG